MRGGEGCSSGVYCVLTMRRRGKAVVLECIVP